MRNYLMTETLQENGSCEPAPGSLPPGLPPHLLFPAQCGAFLPQPKLFGGSAVVSPCSLEAQRVQRIAVLCTTQVRLQLHALSQRSLLHCFRQMLAQACQLGSLQDSRCEVRLQATRFPMLQFSSQSLESQDIQAAEYSLAEEQDYLWNTSTSLDDDLRCVCRSGAK